MPGKVRVEAEEARCDERAERVLADDAMYRHRQAEEQPDPSHRPRPPQPAPGVGKVAEGDREKAERGQRRHAPSTWPGLDKAGVVQDVPGQRRQKEQRHDQRRASRQNGRDRSRHVRRSVSSTSRPLFLLRKVKIAANGMTTD